MRIINRLQFAEPSQTAVFQVLVLQTAPSLMYHKCTTARCALQADDFEAAARDAQSQRSAGGRTARRQAWAANDVFSDSEGEGAPSVSMALARLYFARLWPRSCWLHRRCCMLYSLAQSGHRVFALAERREPSGSLRA